MRRFRPIQSRDRVVVVTTILARRMRCDGHAALRVDIGDRRRGRLIRVHVAFETYRDEVIAGVRDLLPGEDDRAIREADHPTRQTSREDLIVVRHGDDIESGARRSSRNTTDRARGAHQGTSARIQADSEAMVEFTAMIDPHEFAQRRLELTAEFGTFFFEHPKVDDRLPDGASVYFQIDGEAEFNRYCQTLTERRQRDEGVPIVRVRVTGLAPPQGSRLIGPVIEPAPAVA